MTGASRRLHFLKLSLMTFAVTLGVSPLIVEPTYDRLRYSPRYQDLVTGLVGKVQDKLDVYDLDLWMSGPALLGALFIPVVLTAISVALMILACDSRITRFKLAILPTLFFGVVVLGGVRRSDDLLGVGIVLLAAAPNWLGEILRVRASELGLQKLAFFFFCHHCLAGLCVVLVVSQSDFALGVGKLWWFSFIIGLLGFFRALQGSELVSNTDDEPYF
ncbi:MAG: hypothetical protein KC800_28840 [Candidatus Eremiobacteraeota bacterium]|nr:hypothetical protein [Candidatus Eremiobacteraeota bacterium]